MLWIGKLCQAEVDDLDLSVRGQQDVGALDVAVYHAFLMRGLQTLGGLSRDVEGFLERQGIAADLLVEAGALDVGHGDEDLAVDLVDLMNRADVGMLDRRGGLGFAAEAFFGVGVLGQPRGEKLQGNGAVEVCIEGLVDHAHPAFAQFFEQAVVGNDVLRGGSLGQADDFARRVNLLDRADEAVPPPRQSFDKAWPLGGIVQRLSQSADSAIDAVFEINEGSVGPKSLVKRLPRDEFPGAVQAAPRGFETTALADESSLRPCEVRRFSGSVRRFQTAPPSKFGSHLA